MTDPHQLSFLEAFCVGGLISLMLWEARTAWSRRDPMAAFRPTLILAVVLAYYCLIGPLRAIASGEWIDRGLDLRSSMVWAWGGALVFYAAVLVGFHELPAPSFTRRFVPPASPEALHRLGRFFCGLGLAMFTLVVGVRVLAYLNPLAAERLLEGGLGEGGVDVGAIANYFTLAVNFLIPGTVLMWVGWIRQRRHGAEVLAWVLATGGIYTTLGFRYRLVLLLAPFAILWFLARQRRPALALISVFAVALVFVSGLIGLTRQYSRGLDVASLEGRTTAEILESGLAEARVFLTTGGVMRITPDLYPHVGAAPFISTLLWPIPRALFPEKPKQEYLVNATQSLYGSKALATGAAILNFGEYYLIAGWPSLIVLSLLFGWLLRCLWNWFWIRRHESLAQCVYVLTACYLYVAVSRGFLPQVVMLFVFSVAPIYWFYGRRARPVLQASPPTSDLAAPEAVPGSGSPGS